MQGSVVERNLLNVAPLHTAATEKATGKILLVVFSLYLILLAVTVAHHEPWMDEAQAWLLAKDASVTELFSKYLKYEGSPGLWHLILMIPAKLGLPYASLNIISAFFSAVGVALFIRYSPFPFWIKVLFPFTYFTFFQYGVVARNYCLLPALLFLIAMVHKTKMERPVRYSILLCLLANISAHTFLIAGSFMFLHFTELITLWKNIGKRTRVRNVVGLTLFGLIAIVNVIILIPPSDHIFANLANSTTDNSLKVVSRMVGGSLTIDEFSRAYWIGASLSAIAFIVSVIWFTKKRVAFLYLLPLILISALFAFKYRNYWHQGILFFLWLFVVWISFKDIHANERSFYKAMKYAVALVISIHVYWGITAIIFDLKIKYSASASVAHYLKRNNLEKKKIFVSGWKSLSILPYFDEKIFYNYNKDSHLRFWSWSRNNLTPVGADKRVINTIVKEQPGIVIFASHYIPRKKKIKIPGFGVVGTFRGFLCWKTGVLEPESYLIFKKLEEPLDSSIVRPTYQYNLLDP